MKPLQAPSALLTQPGSSGRPSSSARVLLALALGLLATGGALRAQDSIGLFGGSSLPASTGVPMAEDLSSIGLFRGGASLSELSFAPAAPPIYPIPTELRQYNGVSYNLGARRVYDRHAGDIGEINPQQFPARPLPEWELIAGEAKFEAEGLLVLTDDAGFPRFALRNAPDRLRQGGTVADYAVPTGESLQFPADSPVAPGQSAPVYDYGTPILPPVPGSPEAKAVADAKAAITRERQAKLDAAVAKFRAELAQRDAEAEAEQAAHLRPTD